MEIEIVTDIVIAIVATMGLILSIVNYTSSRKDKQLKLKVSLQNGFLGLPSGELSEIMLLPKVANPTEKAINVVSFSFVLPNNRGTIIFPMLQGTRELPMLLDSLDSADFFVPLQDVKDALIENGFRKNVKIRVRFIDGLDNDYVSKKWNIEID